MNVIKVARAKLGWTQHDLADEMNVTRATAHNWENAKAVPSVHQLTKLSLKLEIPLDDLINHFKN